MKKLSRIFRIGIILGLVLFTAACATPSPNARGNAEAEITRPMIGGSPDAPGERLGP